MELIAEYIFNLIIFSIILYWVSKHKLLFAIIIVSIFFVSLAIYYKMSKDFKEKQKREEEERKKREEEWKKDEEERRIAEQNAIYKKLTDIISESKETIIESIELVQSAERSLDQAEIEFNEGVFIPFWDSVEETVINLAMFHNCVQFLHKNALNYESQSSKLTSSPPVYDVDIKMLPDAAKTVERMEKIVRKAQKNFQFASIYMQYKTNQILVSGFSTLASAINELGDRIELSLNLLKSSILFSVASASSEWSSSASNITAEIKEINRKLSDE